MITASNMIGKDWKTVGYWFNEKKSQKFGSCELLEACRRRKLNFKKIDLMQDLDEQEPFDLFFHKLTSIYALALNGNKESIEIKARIEKYFLKKPQLIIMDPIESVEKLLLRVSTYDMLVEVTNSDDCIVIPPYVKLENAFDADTLLEEHAIEFPVVCKPLHAGGGREAHQMAVIFCKDQLRDCAIIPCVAQSFINHNALLFKIFIIGDKWFVTLRPSLKNFEVQDHPPIFFYSHHISKPDSSSPWTQLDFHKDLFFPKADLVVLQRIAYITKNALRSDLLGIDVVIDVSTGNYAVIDVNPFPSFDCVPNVMEHIGEILRKRLDEGPKHSSSLTFHLSSGLNQQYFLQDLNSYFHSEALVNGNQQMDSQLDLEKNVAKLI